MVISHSSSRKGFKRVEEIQTFLTRNAGITKEKVVLEMIRRFKLGYTEANKIYTAWRKKYVIGEIKDVEYFTDNRKNKLELYAEHYAESNRKGYSQIEIINVVNNINKHGIKCVATILNMDIKDVTTIYNNARRYGVIELFGRKKGK